MSIQVHALPTVRSAKRQPTELNSRGLRILVLSTLYPPTVRGGYEVECANVVKHLRGSHEVLVLTSDHLAPTIAEEGVLRELPFVDYRLRDSFRAPITAMRAATVMRRVLDDFRPDLLYVWNGSQIPQAALRVGEASGVPLAYRVCEHWFGRLYRDDKFMRHLVPGERGLRGHWARLMRLVNRHPVLRLDVTTPAPAAICWNSDVVRELGPAPPTVDPILEDKIYPATPQSTSFMTLERRPASEPTLLFVGRLAPEKGPDIAYRALARLSSGHSMDARLILAGPCDDVMRDKLARLAALLGIERRVELRGQVGADELAVLLEQAHVMLIPSTWQEPAPLTCAEAALARIPVVASRTGGIPEMLHDGEHALLFPPGDAEACASAVADVLTHPESTATRVDRAFERAQAFTFERYVGLTDRFLGATMDAFRAHGAPPAVRRAVARSRW